MTFDLARSLRRIKPHRFTQPLRRRPRSDLPFVGDRAAVGPDLLLDTCVYIDVLQGRTSPAVDAMLRLRTLNHLSVCVAELTHCFGRLDSRHPGSTEVWDQVEQTVSAIPPHRLQTARADVVIEAGILAGLVFRLGGLQPGQEVAALNDAILFLHARVNGQVVLTRNERDFDIMDQILPGGQILFYVPAA